MLPSLCLHSDTGGYTDKSELAEMVKEVLKCLSSRAVKPSALRLTLRMLELEKVHAILSHQCLTSIAERESNVQLAQQLIMFNGSPLPKLIIPAVHQ